MTASLSTLGSSRRTTRSTRTSASNSYARGSAIRAALAAVALAAVALSSPLSALSEISYSGRFTTSNIHAPGGAWISANTVRSIVVPQAPEGGRISGLLFADELTVTEFARTRVQIGQAPNDPSQAIFGVSKGPPTQQTAKYDDVSATIAAPWTYSHVLLHAPPDLFASAQLEVAAGSTLRISENQTWRAGTGANATAPPDPNGTTASVEVAAGQVQTDMFGPILRIEGEVRIAFWEGTMSVAAAEGENKVHRSGSSYSGPAGPGTGWALRERTDALIVATAKNASLRLEASNRPASMVSTHVEAFAAAGFHFSAATGMLSNGTRLLAVDDEALTLTGPTRVGLFPSDGGPPRLRVDVEMASGAQSLTETVERARPQPNRMTVRGEDPRAAGNAWSAVGPAGLAVAGLVLLGLSGWGLVGRVASVEAAERALVKGRTRWSRMLALRVLRDSPRDPDALFVLGAGYLKDGRLEKLLSSVGRRATRVEEGQRRGIAFLLALAGLRLGRPDSVRRWTEEASRDPILSARLGEEGFSAQPADADRAYA